MDVFEEYKCLHCSVEDAVANRADELMPIDPMSSSWGGWLCAGDGTGLMVPGGDVETEETNQCYGKSLSCPAPHSRVISEHLQP